MGECLIDTWDATAVQCRLQRHVCRLPLRRDARDFRGCGGKCGASLQVFLACSIAPPWDGSPCREGHPQDLSVHLGASDQVPEFEDTSGAMVALWCSWGRTGPCPKAPEGHHRATIVCIRGQATLAHARGRPPHCRPEDSLFFTTVAFFAQVGLFVVPLAQWHHGRKWCQCLSKC